MDNKELATGLLKEWNDFCDQMDNKEEITASGRKLKVAKKQYSFAEFMDWLTAKYDA